MLERDSDFHSSLKVAEHLKIKTSTLRKYSILLENYGYVISRDYANNRIYTLEDVKMLEDLQSLRERFTLAEAAQLLLKDYQNKIEENGLDDLIDRITELEEKYDDLEAKYEVVLKRLANISKYLTSDR